MILPGIQKAWDVAHPFQVEDAKFAAANGSMVFGHKTGLGKTFISMLAWSQWEDANKALICGTLGSAATWLRLLPKWGGVEPIFIQGKDDPRWNEAVRAKEGVYICTYMTFYYAMKANPTTKPHFDLVVNDELHRMLRTRNKIWTSMKRLQFQHYLGLSATWSSKGPQDCYPVLNLVNRRTFPSYWRFVNTWCHVEQTTFGTEIFGVKNQENLTKMLTDRYYRARTWKEVGYQFKSEFAGAEPTIRRAEIVPMSKKQTKLIEQLRTEMIAEYNGHMVVTQNVMVQVTRLLQLAISPRILFPDGEFGGVIDWLVEQISDDPHTVVFCPFREGLDVVKEALVKDGYTEGRIFTIRGGIRPDELNDIIARWKKYRGVLLCTVAYAQSFDADTTDTAYMLGYDWDPNNNYQAEGRLRRLDSQMQHPCLVRYVTPEKSDYQTVVMGVLDGKVITVRQFLPGYGA